ncbi:MAG: cation-translocating P-type ATPase, partial [Halobacteriota archaeon]
GDVILLEAGDRAPADARLFEAANLKADESALTGESATVYKSPGADASNIVYAGTVITRGRAKAAVVATGYQTEFGKIAQSITQTEREATPLQKNLARLGRWIFVVVVFASALIISLGVLRGESFYDIFLVSVSQAVSAIPEGLPAVITVVLTSGVRAMARNNAYVRRLSAIETLGSTTVILSDKTGTLTRNEMTVTALHAGNTSVSVTGVGYSIAGEFLINGTPVVPDDNVRELLRILTLCNDAVLTPETDGMLGDPTDAAMLAAGAKTGLYKAALEEAFPRIDEIPFDPVNQYMVTLHQSVADGRVAYIKGAPEVILELSSAVYADGKRRPLDDAQKSEITQISEQMAAQGLRVLAAGYKLWEEERLSPDALASDFIFVGLVGMMDPPREEVKRALAESRKAGIRTVMVTGDNPVTARTIATTLGIARADSEVLTTTDLQTMSDVELAKKIDTVSVFARAKPVDKKRLVDAFKAAGNVVAVTGDGINDAPALVSADIGVAMGKSGTEVAKESSDMVLADDNYATIVAAVKEGRRIYDNLRKVLLYLITTNAAQMMIVITAIVTGLPLPLYPIQILWINLITDGICVIPIGLEPEEPDVMERPPHDPKKGIFSTLMKQRIIFLSSIMAAGTLFLFYERLGVYPNIDETRTAAFITISLFQLANALNSRSERPLIGRGLLSNRYLLGAIGIAPLLQLATVYVPFMQVAFRTIPIAAVDYLYIGGACVSLLLIEDARKRIALRRRWHSLRGNDDPDIDDGR